MEKTLTEAIHHLFDESGVDLLSVPLLLNHLQQSSGELLVLGLDVHEVDVLPLDESELL